MKKVILEDDNEDFKCPECGFEMKFIWPPAYHISAQSVNICCGNLDCGKQFIVGGEVAAQPRIV